MDYLNLKKINFKTIFVYVFVFIFCLYLPKDPDLGWHLKYGEYFFQNFSILRDNTFSTEMPDYKYINSAWLTDPLTFLFFKLGGFWGIANLSSIVLTLTFYFFSKAAKLNLIHQAIIFPLVLLFEASVFRASFRGQMLSFLGIGILYYLLSKGDKKSLTFLIPLFFIWANFHGQFILGLSLLLIWVIFKLTFDYFTEKSFPKFIFRRKTVPRFIYELKFLSIIFLSSVLVTFLNPFGVDIYQEVLKHAKNTSQQYIVEWSSVEDYSFLWWYLYIWLFLIGVSSLLIIYRKALRQYFFYIFVAFLLLFLSFQIRRYIWVTFFISIPLIKYTLDFVSVKNNLIKNIFINSVLISGLVFIIFIKIPDLQKTPMNWETYCKYLNCSQRSAQVLESHLNSATLFSQYNWGGWLIWNYPKIKPLIDGRMAFWEDETGYSALKNYVLIEDNLVDIDQTKFDLVYISPLKTVFGRLIQLVGENRWEIIYYDERAFIFKRKINP